MFINRHKFFANVVLLAHLAWTTLVIGGTYYIFRHRWYIPWHLGVVALTLFHNVTSPVCILTNWEDRFRKKYDQKSTLNGSFLSTYFARLTAIELSHGFVHYLTLGFNLFAILLALGLLIF